MDYVSGWCKSKRRLDGCTAIITGCNTGIGRETALDFYVRGARVIMACRDVAKAENTKEELEKETETLTQTGSLVVEKLDLSSLKSVRSFASRMLATEDQMSILVNNAGVMCCPEGKTEDGFETHMGTNHFGHALLTLLLMPKLIRSAPSRVIFVSSYLHQKANLKLDDMNFEKTPYDPLKAYCRSKAANILYAKALAIKLKEHNIDNVTSYSLHPGVVNTEIGRHFSNTLWLGATWLFNHVIGLFLKSRRCGAQTTIYCAVDEECADQSGLYYVECAPTSPAQHCQDDAAAEQLWDLTMEALKLSHYHPFNKMDPEEIYLSKID